MADADTPSAIMADLGLSDVPDSGVLEKIYQHAAELAELESRILQTTEDLQKLVDDRNKLANKTLPALFDQVNTDRFGVPGWNADVVLEPVVHAAIKKDWPDEQQEAAFGELERIGGGDLVKVTLSVEFGKGELDMANALYLYIKRWNEFGNRPVKMEKTVAWNTLTKFVREMLGRKVPMSLDKIGASVFRQCKIVWRKDRGGSVPRGPGRITNLTSGD